MNVSPTELSVIHNAFFSFISAESFCILLILLDFIEILGVTQDF